MTEEYYSLTQLLWFGIVLPLFLVYLLIRP